jgi:DinB family protein
MKTSLRAVITFVLLLGAVRAIAQQQPLPSKTIPDSINYMWKMVESDFTSLAEAMPEEKWTFKPTQGAFADVRTFGEQVKHVACANEAWAKKLRGEKPPDRCDTGGPSPARTKAEILAYLHESFVMLDGEIAKTRPDNLMVPVEGPYAGNNRLEVLNSALWHISDHYGQLVEYVRMNGIVPPASR